MNTKLAVTFKHMRRSPYQSFAAMGLTTITFFIVSVFSLTVLGAHTLLQYFESRPQVTAFFKDSAGESDAKALEDKIKNEVTVESSKYVSKDDALEIYRSQNQDNPLLLEMVTAEILPSSLEISAKNVDDLEKVANFMTSDSNVEEVVYQKDIIDTLRGWFAGIRMGGLALSSLLLIASLATIVVILGLRVTARKVEINTLSLLGASPWYIRAPFVIEGIIYSASGAVLGWGVTYVLLLYITPNLADFLRGIPLLPVSPLVMLEVLAIQLVLASLLGSLASLIATRRYGK